MQKTSIGIEGKILYFHMPRESDFKHRLRRCIFFLETCFLDNLMAAYKKLVLNIEKLCLQNVSEKFYSSQLI